MGFTPPVPPQHRQLHLRLIREVRARWPLFGWVIAAGLLASLAGIGGAWSLSQAVNGIFLQGKTTAEISRPLAMLLILIAARGLLSLTSEAASSSLAVQIKTNLRERIYAHILDLGPAYTQRAQTGSLVNLLTEGIEALDAYYSQYLPQAVFSIVIPLVVLGFVTPVDPLSGLILFLTAPIIPVFMVLIASLSAALAQRQWKTLSRMSAYFLDILQGLTTLKTLGRSKDQIKVMAQVSDRFRTVTMSVLRVAFLSALVMELTATLSTAIIAVEVGIRLLYGKMAFEQAFFVLILVPEFYLPLRLLGLRFHSGMAGAAAARQLYEVLDEPLTPAREPMRKRTRDQGVGDDFQTIRVENVSYAYAENQPVLENVSFEIKPGQKVALVGPSGAGKSTLASLLLRFYTPGHGRIVTGEEDIQDIPVDEWRRKVAWVPQRPFLFYDTVAANIRLARPEASLEEVKAAARLAHADEFIQELNNGYETQIGERGTRLSGGQAQRIALARAFLKDAPLLILDEPTSNLDPETEALLLDSLLRLMRGRTVLVIAHRLSTVYQSDLILVLDGGKIVESGSHPDLIKNEGLYWRMVTGGKISDRDERIYPANFEVPKDEANKPDLEIIPSYPLPLLPRRTWKGDEKTKPLFQLLSLLSPFKGWVFLSILLGFLTVASGVGLMSTSTYIISAAALQPSIAVLQVAIVGVRFFGISRGVFRYLDRIVSHQVTFRLLAQLRVWFYQALEPLAPARLMEARSGDMLSRIIGDIAALENFYVRGAAPSAVALLITLGMAGFMLQFSPWLSLITVAFLALGGIVLPLLIWKTGKEPGAQIIHHRSRLSASVVDGVQGLADLTAFSRISQHFHKVQAENRTLSLAQERSGRLNSLQNALSVSNANLALWAVLVMGVYLVELGQLSGVLLGVLCLAALASFEAVQTLPQAATHLGRDLEAAGRLIAVVQTRPDTPKPPQPLPKPEAFRLEVERVSFAYPAEPTLTLIPSSNGKWSEGIKSRTPSSVLSGISFSISQGEHVAIVGPSGAGKSTLVNLLLRFWDYPAGRILLGGHDLRQYDPEDLRRWFNVLSQNTHLFSGTIRENLLLAHPQAGTAEIEQAVQQAQLYEFITSLPQGYQTWIGEQGLRLSAGERQRLALARAFLRDAPVLILDEATANLDTLLEQKILAEIRQYCLHRARLTITHRLVGLEDANEILVLQRGKVVERGLHAELLHKEGLYRKMWELQNQAVG